MNKMKNGRSIEKGRQKILVHTLWDLADALGVRLKNLLPEEMSFPPALNEPKLPENLSKEETKWLKTVIKGGATHGNPKEND